MITLVCWLYLLYFAWCIYTIHMYTCIELFCYVALSILSVIIVEHMRALHMQL